MATFMINPDSLVVRYGAFWDRSIGHSPILYM